MVVASATFGVVKYKDEIMASVSDIFKKETKTEISDIGLIEKDELAEESDLIEEPETESEPKIIEKIVEKIVEKSTISPQATSDTSNLEDELGETQQEHGETQDPLEETQEDLINTQQELQETQDQLQEFQESQQPEPEPEPQPDSVLEPEPEPEPEPEAIIEPVSDLIIWGNLGNSISLKVLGLENVLLKKVVVKVNGLEEGQNPESVNILLKNRDGTYTNVISEFDNSNNLLTINYSKKVETIDSVTKLISSYTQHWLLRPDITEGEQRVQHNYGIQLMTFLSNVDNGNLTYEIVEIDAVGEITEMLIKAINRDGKIIDFSFEL